MNIIGKTMIFKSEYGYSTIVSNKMQNGEYEKIYVSVQLPKEIELENKTLIEIKSAFLSFYKTKEGLPKIKIVVLDFEQLNNFFYEKKDEDDLPF